MMSLALVASGCVMSQGEDCGEGAACAPPQVVEIQSEAFSVGCPPGGIPAGLLGDPVAVSHDGRLVRGRRVVGLPVDDFVAVSSTELRFCGDRAWGLAYGPEVSQSQLEAAIEDIAEAGR